MVGEILEQYWRCGTFVLLAKFTPEDMSIAVTNSMLEVQASLSVVIEFRKWGMVHDRRRRPARHRKAFLVSRQKFEHLKTPRPSTKVLKDRDGVELLHAIYPN